MIDYYLNWNKMVLVEIYFGGRYLRVLLNGQTLDWGTIQAGVPQSSILGALFFLIYINDLKNNLKSNVKLFADDIPLISEICDPLEIANILNNDS